MSPTSYQAAPPRVGRRTLSNGFSFVKRARRQLFRALQGLAIPLSEVVRGGIRVLEKREQLAVGIRRRPHRLVRQDPLAHITRIDGCGRANLSSRVFEPLL